MKNLFLLLPPSILSIVTCIFVSCDSDTSHSTGFVDSSDSSITVTSSVDARLQVYVNEFLAEAGKRGVALNSDRLNSLVLRFGVLQGDTLGTCASSSEENVITINNNINQSQIRYTVIHELGHCILRMEHRDDVLSIMNFALREAALDRLGDEAAFDEFFQERFFEAY